TTDNPANSGPQDATSDGNTDPTTDPTTDPATESETAVPPPHQANWVPRTFSLPNLDINALIRSQKGVLFAATKQDLYRSYNNGDSWQPAGVDLIRRNVTALAFDEGETLYAASSTGGIYLSYDDGENWTPISGDSVAPEIEVEQKEKNKGFTVKSPKVLPKAPILELEWAGSGKDAILYAATKKALYYSQDRGKTWDKKDPLSPIEQPATEKRLTPVEERAAMLKIAGALLITSPLRPLAAAAPWLRTVVEGAAKATGSVKWWGQDLWDFVRSGFTAPPENFTEITALAAAPPSADSKVVIGTDNGKFTVKERTRRWLVVAVIVALVLIVQYLTNPGGQIIPVQLNGAGEWLVDTQILAKETVTATVVMSGDGILTIRPALEFQPENTGNTAGGPVINTQIITHNFSLQTDVTLLAEKGPTTTTLVATGLVGGIGAFTDSSPEETTAELSSEVIFTATVDSGFVITKPTPISVTLQLDDIFTATHNAESQNPVTGVAALQIDGTVGSPSDDEPGGPVMGIWKQVSALLSSTVIASWQGIESFVTELWDALPWWIQGILRPLYTRLILPIFNFVNTYLIQPLLYQTATTLVKISGITLGVLALLLAWIYADRQMSNRVTVRLKGKVNALVVREDGQIFAGTDDGLFRSLEDDPNAGFWRRQTQALIRWAFPDVPMEPINADLLDDKGKPPVIQTLAIVAAGDVLAATDDGRLFRTSNNGDNWYRYDSGSTLKTIDTVVATPIGQFAAGAVGDEAVEDRWFTAQIKEIPGEGTEKITVGEVDLATSHPNLRTDGWIVLRQPGSDHTNIRYRIADVKPVLSRDFVTSGEFTRITVKEPVGLTDFSRNNSSVLLQSEAVALFDNRPVRGDRITLLGYYPNFQRKQHLIVTGKPMRVIIAALLDGPLVAENGIDKRAVTVGQILRLVEAPTPANPNKWRLQTRDGFVGEIHANPREIRWVAPAEGDREVSEVIAVDALELTDDETTVILESPLTYAYDRSTVHVYGNILHVTHGQTVTDETLGSGSGMQANERFMLPERPLTYVSADNALGAESEITVSVNEVEWNKVPYLYGLTRDERVYIVRQDAQDNSHIIF
ncbi:MAG TPA: hypothetical protein P5121_37935, partial [Caldilineaceae bacterium]|nr:hypothetical protein [Caldilineaceae bacterium]